MTGRTDDRDALVVAAQRGDERAFESLVRATHAETYTLAFRLTGDDEDARDVTRTPTSGPIGASTAFAATPGSDLAVPDHGQRASTLLGQRARTVDELIEESSVADDRINLRPRGPG